MAQPKRIRASACFPPAVADLIVSGSVSPRQLKRAVLHLAGCRECLALLRQAQTRWDEEEQSTREERYEKALDRAFAAALKVSRGLAAREHTVQALLPGLRYQGKLRQSPEVQRARCESDRLFDKASWRERYEAHRRVSWEARYRDPWEMVSQARLAFNAVMFEMKEAEAGGGAQLKDLQAQAQCELANAWRVYNDYPKAWGNLQSAFHLRLQGTREEDLLARLLDVKASIYADQREFTAAHECLDQVLRISRRLRLPRLSIKILVQKGTIYGSAGEFREAIGCLKRVLPRMDPARDDDLVLSVRFNLASFLADVGEHREARRHAWGLAGRFEEAGQRLNAAKVRWLAAKIHRELGELERAERELVSAREGFLAVQDSFLAGLVTLELALLVHRRSRVGEAVSFASEALQIFVGLRIGRDVIASLTFLHTLLGDRQARSERLREIFEEVIHKLQAERGAEPAQVRTIWLDP
jgi:tetratricopeptide (TPR) repeat protein